jgi:hypothetical protein
MRLLPTLTALALATQALAAAASADSNIKTNDDVASKLETSQIVRDTRGDFPGPFGRLDGYHGPRDHGPRVTALPTHIKGFPGPYGRLDGWHGPSIEDKDTAPSRLKKRKGGGGGGRGGGLSGGRSGGFSGGRSSGFSGGKSGGGFFSGSKGGSSSKGSFGKGAAAGAVGGAAGGYIVGSTVGGSHHYYGYGPSYPYGYGSSHYDSSVSCPAGCRCGNSMNDFRLYFKTPSTTPANSSAVISVATEWHINYQNKLRSRLEKEAGLITIPDPRHKCHWYGIMDISEALVHRGNVNLRPSKIQNGTSVDIDPKLEATIREILMTTYPGVEIGLILLFTLGPVLTAIFVILVARGYISLSHCLGRCGQLRGKRSKDPEQRDSFELSSNSFQPTSVYYGGTAPMPTSYVPPLGPPPPPMYGVLSSEGKNDKIVRPAANYSFPYRNGP